ncbi:hypothetical protein BH10PSE17_BH10PSE17_23520 [soil metagenome]
MGVATSHSKLRVAAWVLCVAGIVLHGCTALFKSDHGLNAAVLAWFGEASLAYVTWAVVASALRHPAPAFGAALAMLVADGWMFKSVFIHPRGSTAAVGLAFLPIMNLLVIGPAGALVGWLLGWSVDRKRSRVA